MPVFIPLASDVWATLTTTFLDPRGQSRNAGAQIMKSDSLHTALMIASSSCL